MRKNRLEFCLILLLLNTAVLELRAQEDPGKWSLILGTAEGLTGLDQRGRPELLWSGGQVKKVFSRNTGKSFQWTILTAEGILSSADLRNWEQLNQGLPASTIKVFEDGKTSFLTTAQDIKDLEMDPQNPEIMVCAVKDAVYLSRNGGKDWENLGMPNFRSNGIKAVAAASIDGELTVFCSHSIYGFHYFLPDKSGSKWTELNTGLETLETTDNPDEISDIALWIPGKDSEPGPAAEAVGRGSPPVIIVSQTFRRRIYRLDWEQKKFELIWSGDSGFGTIDSLTVSGNTLRFIQDQDIMEFTIPAKGKAAAQPRKRKDLADLIAGIPKNLDLKPVCAALPERSGRTVSGFTCLSELWLLSASGNLKDITAPAAGREGIYLPVNHAMDPFSLAPYLETIKTRNLNMVVIDMKDDYGRIRFTPQDPELKGWGRVFRPVDIEVFLKEMQSAGIYTVARIVVFKDPETANKEKGKYAVWDSRKNKPWEGYYDTRRPKGSAPADEGSSGHKIEVLPAAEPEYEILRTYYDEQWVDPYAEEYWNYITLLSRELIDRGFDEIQFDYIRFPTDGINLPDAQYRWHSAGMDMDSAIVSFLRHVRTKVKAPISVDIYGANGWYRTGARTGQEVELLAPLVDIICPMYYPSHFEQYFLAQDPPELRPYRIYSEGILRTSCISREKIIVRPWVQAFYLNVSYDRRYYNTDYIRREIEGVRKAGNGGYTYWNNLGRYEDLPLP